MCNFSPPFKVNNYGVGWMQTGLDAICMFLLPDAIFVSRVSVRALQSTCRDERLPVSGFSLLVASDPGRISQIL